MSIITDYKNLLFESLRDNKKLIIGLYVIFIIMFIVAWIFTFSVSDAAIGALKTANATVSNSPAIGDNGLSALDIFMQNELGGIAIYISSIFFAIPAIAMLVLNAFNISTVGPVIGHLMPGGSLQYIVYLIPHGIFEFTAIVLECVAGVMFFLFIVRFIKAWRSTESNGFKDAFEMSKKILIQSLAIMVLVTILFLIAAPIETYVSVPLSYMIFGA